LDTVAGVLRIEDGSTLTTNDPVTIKGDATIEPGSTLTAPTVTIDGGSLGDEGTVVGDVVVTDNGRLYGCSVPVPIEIDGSYTQDADGELDLIVDGPATLDHDLMTVTGAVSLNGTLNVDTSFWATPSYVDSIKVISAGGSIAGAFSPAPQFPL